MWKTLHTLQRTATYCNTTATPLQYTATIYCGRSKPQARHAGTRNATHCNTSAMHCNTTVTPLQHRYNLTRAIKTKGAARGHSECNALQHHCNALLHHRNTTASHYNTTATPLQLTAGYQDNKRGAWALTTQRTAMHCTTIATPLQHHCNALQHYCNLLQAIKTTGAARGHSYFWPRITEME